MSEKGFRDVRAGVRVRERVGGEVVSELGRKVGGGVGRSHLVTITAL